LHFRGIFGDSLFSFRDGELTNKRLFKKGFVDIPQTLNQKNAYFSHEEHHFPKNVLYLHV
jgi:hypothetical protein